MAAGICWPDKYRHTNANSSNCEDNHDNKDKNDDKHKHNDKDKAITMTIIILGGIRDKLLQKGLESQTLCLPLTGDCSPSSTLSLSSSPPSSKSSIEKIGQAIKTRGKAIPASSSLPKHKSPWVSGQKHQKKHQEKTTSVFLRQNKTLFAQGELPSPSLIRGTRGNAISNQVYNFTLSAKGQNQTATEIPNISKRNHNCLQF